ncbi:MAG: Crp/Fnr family transcriptional regulator [Propionibacteriaceae bacterium]|jgi:CRP-like cAMP-binding protein|nr:Crp/Fnr family transcriptional regulator [Propionibacteriaceae bacterium]
MPSDTLRINTLLSDVDAEALAALAESARTRVSGRGEVIFRAGDEPDGIFLIDSGRIKLTWGPFGATAGSTLEILGPGHIFGEVSVCARSPRIGDAVALTSCELRYISSDDINRLVAEYPALTRVLLFQMAHRLRFNHCIQAVFTRSDVPGRVAFVVLLLASRFGERRPDGCVQVCHEITQSELASMIGASREAVNKALSDFATRRWIALGTKSLSILNWHRLRRRAGVAAGPMDDSRATPPPPDHRAPAAAGPRPWRRPSP